MSYATTADIIDVYGDKYLIYTYYTNKDVRNNNPSQFGTAKLLLNGGELSGEYWTTRKTTGTMILTKILSAR